MKKIMSMAWKIYRTLTTGTHREKLSVALKAAWAELTTTVKTVAEKLIEAGYKVWTGGTNKRIYVNDASKYSKVERGAVVYKGKQDVIINGISVWDNVKKASTFNTFVRRIETESLGVTMYYDVVQNSWFSNAVNSIEKAIVKAVVNEF